MAGGNLAALNVKLTADASSYTATFQAATDALSKFAKDQQKYLEDIAGALIGAFSVDKLVEFAKSTIDASAELQNFSQSTGIAVEQLSALQFAAKASGVGTDALNVSIKKLNVSLAEAAADSSSKAGQALAAMGVSAKNADGSTKSASVAIDQIANKFAGYADGANKVALATTLFGKSGEALIPLLDKGAAGIDALKASAEAAGAVISGETARAADEFNSKMLLLKTTLVDGVGAQLEAKLLPTLSDLANLALAASKDVGGLSQAAEVLGAGLKILVTAGIEVVEVFENVGDAIGAAAAAIVSIGSGGAKTAITALGQAAGGNFLGAMTTAAQGAGNFSQAITILSDNTDRAAARQKANAQLISDVWKAGTADALNAIDVTAKKILQQAPPVIDLSKYIDELKAYAASLGEQAAKLDQGTIAATKYKLSHGELAVALEKTGAAGQVFADSALASAAAIEKANLGKEIANINAGLLEFSGDTVTAGILKQAASTQILAQRLTDLGGAAGAAGIASVQAAQQNNTYLLEFNKLSTDAARVQGDLAAAIANTNALRSNDAITSLQQLQQLDQERTVAAQKLADIAQQQTVIATQSKNPALIQQAQAATAAVTTLASTTDSLTKQIRGDLEDSLVNPLLDAETGAKSFKQAFSDMVKSIEKDLLTIANKNIAESLFGAAGPAGGAAGGLASLFSGSSGSGGASGVSSFFSSLFGGGSSNAAPKAISAGTQSGIANILNFAGGAADGGTFKPGQWGVVGENGPELAMAGAKDLSIVPRMPGGGTNVTNHFTIQSQNGQISRQSQMQAAAAVARSVGQASARNNRS